jgi:hypothetical protein
MYVGFSQPAWALTQPLQSADTAAPSLWDPFLAPFRPFTPSCMPQLGEHPLNHLNEHVNNDFLALSQVTRLPKLCFLIYGHVQRPSVQILAY